MTEKHPPPSTQTALTTPTLPPLNPLSPTPLPKAFSSQYTPLSTFSSAAASYSDSAAVAKTSVSPKHNGAPTPKVEEPAAEDEPYTIKCICGFTGDDGNTILCEICDSWQHIECFYPNNSEEATREEFAHACHECKPRPLNVAHAVEYQRQRLQAANAEAATHTRTKRPPSKGNGQSHKKKAKPTDLQINGHSTSASDVTRHDINGHAPAKKSKSSHKSSQSVGGSHSKRSPSYSASRTSLQGLHPLSPATTPPDLPEGTEMYGYSSDFLNLCNDQDSAQNVQTNSFASLAVSNATSIWLREPEKMLKDAGQKFEDIFQELPSNIEAIRRPPRVEVKKRVLEKDAVVRWRYLVSSVAVDKDIPLMELNGQIGFQKDYCAIAANRYEELSCSLPFVFFHPQLPLYIDTRREGSLARYVRRSCRPNAVLDTYLSGGTEYHFWLVSDRPIAADEQITIPWDFRLPHDQKDRMFRLLGLVDDDSSTQIDLDLSEDEFLSIARWISQVLSRYGGCACDLGPECALARFLRVYSARFQQARSSHSKKKSSRKSKSHALSPTSTGHATNSRAASEGHPEDLHEDKTSTSSRSKPPSRDMTPAPRQGSFDTLGILTEPTDRDKRKVAMVEDSFRRLEQQQPKKKKRVSDGTTTTEKSSVSSGHTKSSKSKHASHEATNGTSNGNYVDAETSRSKSNSPVTSSPNTMNGGGFMSLSAAVGGSTYSVSRHTSAGPSLGYRDAETQTDPTEGEWYSEKPPTPRPKRRVISLSRRLLNHRYRTRCDETEPVPSLPAKMDVDTATNAEQHDDKASVAAKTVATSAAGDDVTMSDAPDHDDGTVTAKIEPVDNAGSGIDVPIKRSPDLRVQLPKVPSFNDANLQSATTPMTASAMVQSPFAVSSGNPFNSPVVTPSPIKKKMSLSDYTKSRKAAAGRPPTTLKPSSHAEEAKSAETENAPPADPTDAAATAPPTS
ncbi:SET domain-containing protein 3 [Sporothrix bragantina]|uniref:SET domain-containing protein 3 n=1 Tax=Sporothrix bragantina TaxID=671064 RepID=A0ABP0CT83_9PEZI